MAGRRVGGTQEDLQLVDSHEGLGKDPGPWFSNQLLWSSVFPFPQVSF